MIAKSKLILCEVADQNGRRVKRWCKPETPVAAFCTQCGSPDGAFASAAATHVCMDCYTCKEGGAK